MHTGSDGGPPPHGLVRTAAARPAGAPPAYALEGSVFVTGAAVQWLRDGLGLLSDAAESERLATAVEDNGGVHFVPALAGLGSPHWEPDARGLITGITRGTQREHLVRAALEAIAHQTADVVEAMPVALETLRADGGATANAFLMQLQADLLGCRSRSPPSARRPRSVQPRSPASASACGTTRQTMRAELIGEAPSTSPGSRRTSCVRAGNSRCGACSEVSRRASAWRPRASPSGAL